MRRKIFTVFIILSFITVTFYLKSFFWWGEVTRIENIAQKQTIILQESIRPKSVYGINILITGYIDGSATIQRVEGNRKIYEPSIIKGLVNLRLGGDWYDDKCLIIYEPSNVKSGKLQLRYKFNAL
jgi:hypothetical protein